MSQTQTMSQTPTPKIKSRFAAILRATSGNFLEQFDFFLFGFYAGPISKAFFPAGNEYNALLLTFTTFWLGALMRPVGAIVLGAYLDKIGRRKGLIVTLAIMATGTIVIAVCPTYAAIGIAAPVVVLIGRLLQGFSAGVELGGVSIYLFEIATPGNKGFYTAFQSASQQVAIFVAAILGFGLNWLVSLPPQEIAGWQWPSAIGFLLNAVLPLNEIAGWGWRIPFFIGCLIVPLIFVIRRSLEETPDFAARRTHPTTAQILRSVADNWETVILGMNLVALTTVMFYFITVYTPSFGRNVLKLTDYDSLLVTLCVAATNFFWLPVGGALSDRFGRKAVLISVSLLVIATAYPALWWLVQDPRFGTLLAVDLTFSFYFGIYNGAMVVALSELVPAHVRASGFSLAYSLAAALFGTFTPLISTILFEATHNRAVSGFWLMFAAYCSLMAAAAFYRPAGQAQEQAQAAAG
jgi:MHS family citrate/tricarballylate:H+ symporter-like MFS transporter